MFKGLTKTGILMWQREEEGQKIVCESLMNSPLDICIVIKKKILIVS